MVEPDEVEVPANAVEVEEGDVEVAVGIAQDRTCQRDVVTPEPGGDPGLLGEHAPTVGEAPVGLELAGALAHLVAIDHPAVPIPEERTGLKPGHVERGRGDILHHLPPLRDEIGGEGRGHERRLLGGRDPILLLVLLLRFRTESGVERHPQRLLILDPEPRELRGDVAWDTAHHRRHKIGELVEIHILLGHYILPAYLNIIM